tara:strand:+ start:125 stop:562 length:438 start_codon:yes stop_codon:yes gene_type:complete
MAIYSERGLALTFSGDLQVGANGDVKIDDAFESEKSAVNWFLRTNKGDYVPDQRLGCNVGTYIGDKMSRSVLSQLEDSVLSNLVKFVAARTDIRVDAVPIDCDSVGIFVSVGGKYLDTDGNLLEPGVEVLTYVFPYLEGQPTPLP